jgi:hypothetical protein
MVRIQTGGENQLLMEKVCQEILACSKKTAVQGGERVESGDQDAPNSLMVTLG